MYTACIFDLDGVICHTDEFHFLAWKRLCDTLGLRFDRSVNNLLRGVSRRESLEIILRHNNTSLDEKDIHGAMEKKNEWYREYLERMVPSDLEDDVLPLLSDLKGRGMKLAIGSSSRNARLILGRLGIMDVFDAVADGTMISHSKPHPQVFLVAASLLDAEPSRCVVVEDAHAGIQAAQSAGMACIAYRLPNDDLGKGVLHASNFTEIGKLLK
ncbi:beta-phosphoglucomutase [Parasphaerochaeta coccoides]|uniref:Beta-phosphoglucomutase n=1 Tax=Parasphaerochaeta coccoides (strain ATCC BAA-1237 / DSM 17374 / SPN1) TaxID=760011 RepID=F4GIX2_PARC1|nr:beta-phosphoglucomutase [Parasphaerochaeta coccoides]AEC02740.1 beta-phosphoglucomutase [Parasphaerochaeta coccoides DSM 17374]